MFKKILTAILIFLAVVLVAYLIAGWLAEPAPNHPYFTSGPPRPWVLAHQGGDGLWPGDTLYAFERAAALGVDVLEMDVHSTKDGVLVLMHDETVDRTTNGSGLIKEMTFDEIRQLDAGYDWTQEDSQETVYRGQGIVVPALEELFQAFPGKHMNIEIKQSDPSIAEQLCQLIRQYNMNNLVLIASFNTESIQEFRQVCPEVATTGAEDEVRGFFIRHLLFLAPTYTPNFNAVQVPEYSGGLHVLTPRFIEDAHKRNLEVHAWTINEKEDMQRLLEMNIDGIITDYPDRLMEVLGRQP
jgi:glycerophosphoryl diester phosphodiesterase